MSGASHSTGPGSRARGKSRNPGSDTKTCQRRRLRAGRRPAPAHDAQGMTLPSAPPFPWGEGQPPSPLPTSVIKEVTELTRTPLGPGPLEGTLSVSVSQFRDPILKLTRLKPEEPSNPAQKDLSVARANPLTYQRLLALSWIPLNHNSLHRGIDQRECHRDRGGEFARIQIERAIRETAVRPHRRTKNQWEVPDGSLETQGVRVTQELDAFDHRSKVTLTVPINREPLTSTLVMSRQHEAVSPSLNSPLQTGQDAHGVTSISGEGW